MLICLTIDILRHFADLYPSAKLFIFRELSPYFKKFLSNIDEKTSKEEIKTLLYGFDQDLLEKFHQNAKTTSDLKDFSKEILSVIYQIVLDAQKE